MRHFKMNANRLFKIFGTKVKVWDITRKPTKPPADNYFLGEPVDSRSWINSIEPEIRYEPVLPYSSSYQKYAFAGVVNAGGTEEMYNLSFYSKGDFGVNSIVEVPSQSSDKFRIVSKAEYKDFGDIYVYQLRGDNQHENG